MILARRLIILMLSALFVASCSDKPPAASAVGTLEWDRIEVVTRLAEPILNRQANEGSAVVVGQDLMQLDDRRQRARLQAAQAARAQAAAQVAELQRGTRQERLAQARARLQGSERNVHYQAQELARLQTLLNRKLASADQVDQVRNTLDTARAERDALRANLDELEHGATAEEREQARQALAAAEAQLQLAELDLEHTLIKAPVSGRLDELPFKVGERPAVGTVVAVLLAGQRPYARVYVPEAIRVRVRPGTAAQVQIDGYPNVMTGRVRKVAADPSFTPYYALTEQDRGRLSYLAEIELDSDDQALPAGLPVQAQFMFNTP